MNKYVSRHYHGEMDMMNQAHAQASEQQKAEFSQQDSYFEIAVKALIEIGYHKNAPILDISRNKAVEGFRNNIHIAKVALKKIGRAPDNTAGAVDEK
jgi:hypothetical protein